MSQLPSASSSPQGSTKLVILALVIAGVALVLVNGYIEYVRSQAREGQFIVYRLNSSVEPGEELEQNMVNEVAVPERFDNSFNDAIRRDGLEAKLGQPVLRYAQRNDVLTYSLFTDPDENALDRRIEDGSRLKALPVNPRTIPGVLRPGMYVDIEAPFPGGGPNVMPVMERVRVMVIGDYSIVDESEAGTNAPDSFGNFSTISVEVTPEQATQLAEITKLITGDYEIHVRNPGDRGHPKIEDGGINPDVLELLDQNRTAQR